MSAMDVVQVKPAQSDPTAALATSGDAESGQSASAVKTQKGFKQWLGENRDRQPGQSDTDTDVQDKEALATDAQSSEEALVKGTTTTSEAETDAGLADTLAKVVNGSADGATLNSLSSEETPIDEALLLEPEAAPAVAIDTLSAAAEEELPGAQQSTAVQKDQAELQSTVAASLPGSEATTVQQLTASVTQTAAVEPARQASVVLPDSGVTQTANSRLSAAANPLTGQAVASPEQSLPPVTPQLAPVTTEQVVSQANSQTVVEQIPVAGDTVEKRLLLARSEQGFIRDRGINTAVPVSESASGLTTQETSLLSRAPASADSVALKTPSGQSVPQQVNHTIRVMLGQGTNSATVNLSPADLGSMRINIDMKSDQIQVQIVATQAGTRDVIEAALPRLREQLIGEGYEGVTINLGGGGLEDSRSDQPDESQSTLDYVADDNQDSTVTPVPPEYDGNTVASGKNLVDIFA